MPWGLSAATHGLPTPPVSLRERVPEPMRTAVTCFVLQDGEWTSRTAVQETIGGT